MNKPLTPEDIAGKWKQITDFGANTTHPDSPAEATSMLMQGAGAQRPKKAAPSKSVSGNQVLEKAQSIKVPPGEYKYDSQEGILFCLKLFIHSHFVQLGTWSQENRFEMGLRRSE